MRSLAKRKRPCLPRKGRLGEQPPGRAALRTRSVVPPPPLGCPANPAHPKPASAPATSVAHRPAPPAPQKAQPATDPASYTPGGLENHLGRALSTPDVARRRRSAKIAQIRLRGGTQKSVEGRWTQGVRCFFVQCTHRPDVRGWFGRWGPLGLRHLGGWLVSGRRVKNNDTGADFLVVVA